MMAELPTAIMLALFTLVLIRWIQSKGQRIYLGGALGGINALATLLRLNTFIFLPFTLIIFLIVLFGKWKKLAMTAVFVYDRFVYDHIALDDS